MRNLLEYPVTTEEIVNLLSEIKEAHERENKDVFGDMFPVIIEEAIHRVLQVH